MAAGRHDRARKFAVDIVASRIDFKGASSSSISARADARTAAMKKGRIVHSIMDDSRVTR